MKTIRQKSNKKIVFGMLFAIVLLFTTYSYAIASTTFSVSDMKTKNVKISELQTEISELEYEYFSIIDDLPSNIYNYNLEDIKTIGYASIDNDVKVAFNY